MAVTDFLSPEQLQQMMDQRFGTSYEEDTSDLSGNGQYDQSEVLRKSKNPAINYEGLYEDPMPKTRSYNPFKAMRSDVVLDPLYPSYYKNNPDMLSPGGLKYDDLHLRMDFEKANQGLMPHNWWSRGIDDPRFKNFNPRVGQPSLGYQESDQVEEQVYRRPPLNQTNMAGIPAATNITSPVQDFSFSEYQGPSQEPEGIPAVAQKKGFLPTIFGALNRYNPLYEGSQNYNPNLQGQIDAMNKENMLSGAGGKTGPYRITGGNLAGQNLVSMFGTNDYNQMLQNKIDRMDKTLAGLSTQGWSEDEEIRKRGIFEAKKQNIINEQKFAQQIQQQKIDLANEAASRKAPSGGGWKPDPGRSYSGPELSQIGLQHYTGPGMAFEAKKSASGRGPKQEGGRVGYKTGGRVGILSVF